jgi:hypothetical protein
MAQPGPFPRNSHAQWRSLVQGAAWIMALVGSFLLAPPIWESLWKGLAGFVVAALTGLMYVPITRFAGKQHTLSWWIIALVSLVAGMALTFVYLEKRYDWSAEYAGARMIIGGTLTDDATKYTNSELAKGHAKPGASDLLKDYGGKPEDIWLADEIHYRRNMLLILYVASLVLLTISIMSIPQAIYCGASRSRPAARRPAAST